MMRTQTIDPTNHTPGCSVRIETVPTATAPLKVASTERGRNAKPKKFTSRLWRATRNRLLLSVPLAGLTMACFYMGFRWLKQANIDWLQGDGVQDCGFLVILALSWASVSRLETILRSMIGEEHFDC